MRKLLLHSNPDNRGDPVAYGILDEPHAVRVLACFPHPRMGGGARGNLVVAHVELEPWKVRGWTWLDLVPEECVRASVARLSNEGAIRLRSSRS